MNESADSDDISTAHDTPSSPCSAPDVQRDSAPGVAEHGSASPAADHSLCLSTRIRILVSRPNAIRPPQSWDRDGQHWAKGLCAEYGRYMERTATTAEDGGAGSRCPRASCGVLERVLLQRAILIGGRPARVVGALHAEVSHGRLRDSGSLAASGLGPCRGGIGCGWQYVAGGSHPPETGERRAQRGAVAVLDLCHASFIGALLGFTIVVAWEQFSSAEANVSNEASTLITMYRQTVGMPVPEQTQMRELLRKYAKAVEGPEWENAIRAGGGTESARDALNEMYWVLGSEQSSVASSPISQKFLDQLDHFGVGAESANPGRQTANTRACCGPGSSSAVSYCWRSAVSCAWGAYVLIYSS